MKKEIIVSIVMALLYFPSFAQTNEVALKDLEMPSSPAFILLDVAPSSIERPTTSKAFTTSILNSVNENNGIPENYAVDFVPFWFFKHKRLSAINYWGFKPSINGPKPRQTFFSQARFTNLSFATVKSNNELDTSGSSKSLYNIALGFRTTLFQIRNPDDVDRLNDLNAQHTSRLSALMQDPMISPADLLDIIGSDTFLINRNEEIKNILKRKPLFAIDLAAAGSWSFENQDYNSIEFNRMGAWITFNYSQSLNKKEKIVKNDFFNVYANGRLLNDQNGYIENDVIENATIFDTGGKLEMEFGRLSLSYEYLYRSYISIDSDNTFRSSGLIKYRASDQILISAAFGKNFGDSNNLISQIGLSWGLNSKNQIVDL